MRGREALEVGEEEGEGEVEEDHGGDGPGRDSEGVLGADPHVGHGEGEQSTGGGQASLIGRINRRQGDIGQDVCGVVQGSQPGEAGSVEQGSTPARGPRAVGHSQAKA